MNTSPYKNEVFEADGWTLRLEESGKRGSNLYLERGKGSEYLGEILYNDGGVEKFCDFLERYASAIREAYAANRD